MNSLGRRIGLSEIAEHGKPRKISYEELPSHLIRDVTGLPGTPNGFQIIGGVPPPKKKAE